ncbi:MAG: DUF1343 domain-containing protein [Anaerolineae bacterium]|nr:DUF1343 domain-containing protein [Anaerolineae bacterium]
MTTLTGLEVLIGRDFAELRGRRVGLLSNPSAVTRDLVSAYRSFADSPGVDLRALFGPEHGFAASATDGAHVESSVDARTGVPVYSLYGPSLRPSVEMLDGIDVLVCDIQDIGVRYYTFAWTVSIAIEAAGEAGIEVIVLDRPNPLGERIDGLPGSDEFASLVGLHPIPAQHGLTLGELMRLVNRQWSPTPAALTVIPCQGYTPGAAWAESGLPFVPPSPAMPHISTVLQYPGACLLEGTNLSEGRGTALPFEICGAPYVEAEALADALNALNLPGVRYRPHVFRPTSSKHAGETCFGVQVHVTGPAYRPLAAWVAVLQAIRHLYADEFEWLPSYSGSTMRPFDRLARGEALRGQVDANTPLDLLTAEWDAAAVEWRALREEALLYPRKHIS